MGMLSVQDALTQILQSISPLGTEQVLMLDGLGRSLAEPLMARRQLPAWDNSAMDGYALRAADVQEGHAPLVVWRDSCGHNRRSICTERTLCTDFYWCALADGVRHGDDSRKCRGR